MGQYDVAQVCENGHVVTDMFRSYPHHGRKFCEKCGAPTIHACPKCSEPIPGYYDVEGVISFSHHYEPPSFCGDCGEPFPWAATALSELHEIAKMVDGLSDEERERLQGAIDELVKDSPRTERAALTLKTLAPKLGQEAWGAMRAILISVATEAAKRSMGRRTRRSWYSMACTEGSRSTAPRTPCSVSTWRTRREGEG